MKAKTSKTSDKPFLSLITVNYNGFEDTCQMIDSFYRTVKSVEYEIIVVDNCSLRNESNMLKKKYPFIRVISSTYNRGFAGGNNLGIKYARGNYLLFLNNDTFILEDNFAILIKTLETDTSLAGLSPLIRYAEEGYPIQFAGYTPLSRFTLRNRSYNQEKDIREWDTPKEIPYMHGAAMLVKTEICKLVGGLPEMYFLYYEEFDWSVSINRAGYMILFDPRQTVYHKESRSTGKNSPMKAYYMMRNRLLYAYRNRQVWDRFWCFLYLLFIAAPANCFRYFMHGNIHLINATLRGMWDYFKLKKEDKLENYDFKYFYIGI